MKAQLLLLSLFLAAGASAQPTTIDGSHVIARQSGVEVTVEDFHAAMHEIPEADRLGFAQDPQRLTRLVANTLRAKYLAAQAEKDGVEPPYLEARLRATRNRHLAELQIQRMRASIEVPDFTQSAREKFLVNKQAYDIPETGAIRYIALSIAKRGDDEARQLAIELQERAAAGEDFEVLLKEYSDEPERLGNERGSLPEYALDEKPAPDDALAQVMIGVQPGEIAKPFKQRNNYYIAKLISRTPGRPATFEEVRDDIVAEMRNEYVSTQLQEMVSAYERSPLELDEDVLPDLREMYANPQR